MKKLIFALIILSSLAVHAQDTSTLPLETEEEQVIPNFWQRFVFSERNVAEYMASRDSSDQMFKGELGIGYVLSDRFELDTYIGQGSTYATTSGGDLSQWTYYETETKGTMTYEGLDVKYIAWQSNSKRHAIYVQAGTGVTQIHADYDYSRYRPNNGVIKIGDKVLSESDGGNANSSNEQFVRASAGYSFSIVNSPIHPFKVFAGVETFQILNPEDLQIHGENHNANYDTAHMSQMTYLMGLSIQI